MVELQEVRGDDLHDQERAGDRGREDREVGTAQEAQGRGFQGRGRDHPSGGRQLGGQLTPDQLDGGAVPGARQEREVNRALGDLRSPQVRHRGHQVGQCPQCSVFVGHARTVAAPARRVAWSRWVA